jgi:hypothetical protein
MKAKKKHNPKKMFRIVNWPKTTTLAQLSHRLRAVDKSLCN